MIRLIWLLVLTIGVAGCSSANSGASSNPPREASTKAPVQAEQYIPVSWGKLNVKQVTISRSQRFGSVNPAVLATFEEPEQIALFTESLESAVEINGILDVRKPDYDLIFVDGDDQQTTVHLWLSPQKDSAGMYTYVSNTGTGYTVSEEAADKLSELIRGITYPAEQAANNGEVVNEHGKLVNLDKWTQFMKDVKKGTPSEVHMTSYTLEGGAIFQDLIFDGETIEFTFDNTWDSFGSPTKVITFCKSINQQGTEFTLAECDREDPAFFFSTDIVE
ncbi:DUF4362 domain-containing protein [Cohnella sp. WQ 127256]|uniref:DUF4362 domain-containing protein n=1 Tax=Cohnella sp. WQ 127256 TaxID=2938790 RepID=UPI0021182913|nr:DUF4362 domain-containing protein [Cohnella sp. WQ 127256]